MKTRAKRTTDQAGNSYFTEWLERQRKEQREARWISIGVGTIIVLFTATWLITWWQVAT